MHANICELIICKESHGLSTGDLIGPSCGRGRYFLSVWQCLE